jgi:Zn finger protein HypA/HybF involved in hydrogenase expression
MFCEVCKIEFTDSEYENHLFNIRSKIICPQCHSSDIKIVVHNNIIHSICTKCGMELA